MRFTGVRSVRPDLGHCALLLVAEAQQDCCCSGALLDSYDLGRTVMLFLVRTRKTYNVITLGVQIIDVAHQHAVCHRKLCHAGLAIWKNGFLYCGGEEQLFTMSGNS